MENNFISDGDKVDSGYFGFASSLMCFFRGLFGGDPSIRTGLLPPTHVFNPGLEGTCEDALPRCVIPDAFGDLGASCLLSIELLEDSFADEVDSVFSF
jgi:hypothetical protein